MNYFHFYHHKFGKGRITPIVTCNHISLTWNDQWTRCAISSFEPSDSSWTIKRFLKILFNKQNINLIYNNHYILDGNQRTFPDFVLIARYVMIVIFHPIFLKDGNTNELLTGMHYSQLNISECLSNVKLFISHRKVSWFPLEKPHQRHHR